MNWRFWKQAPEPPKAEVLGGYESVGEDVPVVDYLGPKGWSSAPLSSAVLPVEESCGTCRCFIGGTCRRWPPSLAFVYPGNGAAPSVWPRVSAGEWCGEWRA